MMFRQLQADADGANADVPERDEKELAEAFRLFDLNRDGLIDWDELKVRSSGRKARCKCFASKARLKSLSDAVGCCCAFV